MALHTIGWKAFQDFCSTVVAEVLGQTAEVYLPVKDGGRDGAFRGAWKATDKSVLTGTFTVQCKHTSVAGKTLKLAALTDEVAKARKLAAAGLADNYLVLTNHPILAVDVEKIRKAFTSLPGIKTCHVFGADWLEQKVKESSRLRMMVPRIYGLGDLSLVIDERHLEQAKAILESIGDDVIKALVVTDAHIRATNSIQTHGFALLLGEPGSGKSTIAASLAIGAIDSWGLKTYKVTTGEEFQKRWNPNDPKQFFWVDDAFGGNHYQKNLVDEWNRYLPHLASAVRSGCRFIFTSRDYIFRAAEDDLKLSAFPVLRDAQVKIVVEDFSSQEKRQILYNHIRMGKQSKSFRAGIKPHLEKASLERHLLPEVARRLGDPLFTSKIDMTEAGILHFVKAPKGYLVEVLKSLDTHSFAALSLIFMRGGKLESPMSLTDEEKSAVELLRSDLGGVRESLLQLNRSLTMFESAGESREWKFRHPTIRDAVGEIVGKDPELLGIYLSGAPIADLLLEISCGDVGLEGVKIVVPPALFSLVLNRLGEVRFFDSLLLFLTHRCDRKFLEFFKSSRPDVVGKAAQVAPYLSASRGADLIVKLHSLGLLSEDLRKEFVGRLAGFAIDVPDLGFLTDEGLRSVLAEDEIKALILEIEQKVLPRLEEIVDGHQSDWDKNVDPEDWFVELKGPLESLLVHLSREENRDLIDDALRQIEGAIDTLKDQMPIQEWEPDDDRITKEAADSDSARSIFDDIDS